MLLSVLVGHYEGLERRVTIQGLGFLVCAVSMSGVGCTGNFFVKAPLSSKSLPAA